MEKINPTKRFRKFSKFIVGFVCSVFGVVLVYSQSAFQADDHGFVVGILNPPSNASTSEPVAVDDMPSPYVEMQFIWLPVNSGNTDDNQPRTFHSLPLDSVIYADFYLLPGVVSSYSELPEISNYPIAAMTGLVNAEDSLGELVFVHGNGVGGGIWQSTGSYVELEDGFVSEQLWYVYKLDYVSHLYDFFLNGVLIAENVPFIDSSVTQFDQIEAETSDEEEVHVNRLTISHVKPAGLSQKSDTEVVKKSGGKKRTASLPTANFRVSESVSGDEEMFIALLAASGSSEVDTDGDGMTDEEERANGLDSAVDDAMLDFDGDGYPNIYELRGSGGNPIDAAVTPTATYIVGKGSLADYNIIQDAIDAVTYDYSIILVRTGIYTGEGNPDFEIDSNDPKMLLISSKGAEDTILDGEGVRRGGQIKNDNSALVGFTIRYCEGGTNNGILHVTGSKVLIENNILHDNSATYGGGMYITGNEAIVQSNVFYNNSATYGGGLYISGNEVLVRNNELRNNKASYYGGGISCNGDDVLISNCKIYNNEAIKDGGGIYASGSKDLSVDSCRIYYNEAASYGGGMYVFNSSGAVVRNTLIFSNQATLGSSYGDASYGGGICVSYSKSSTGIVQLLHTTLHNNTAKYGPEIYYIGRSTSNLILTNSIIWNDTETDVLGGSGTLTASYSIINEPSGSGRDYVDNGNVSNEDPNLSFQGFLTKASNKAIDNGANKGVTADFHREIRPTGNGYDIGADEWVDDDGDGLPDWLEALGVTEPFEDSDHDGLKNRFEYKNGTDPMNPDTDEDGLSDGEEHNLKTDPLDPDTDGDEMLDGEEEENGLNPLLNDTMADKDGDGYPNIYELRNEDGNPENAAVTPKATYTLGEGVLQNVLQNAIDAVTTDYSIILVKSGIYTGDGNPNFKVNSDDPKMLIISEEGAAKTILDGKNVQRGGKIENTRSSLVGFTIRNCEGIDDGGGLYLNGDEILVANCMIQNNHAGNGGGVYINDGLNVIIQNTLIRLNRAKNRGGGIYFSKGSSDKLNHATLNNNEAVVGSELYKSSAAADLVLTNSIVWNDTDTNIVGGSEFTANYCIIKVKSGYVNNGNVSNEDPNLGFRGFLTKASYKAIDNGANKGVTADFHREIRPTGNGYDIGADEWVDDDGDGLPDWLEALGVTEPFEDSDHDGLKNRFEYKNGTDPMNPDTDEDGFSDGQEILTTETNPLVPDIEDLDVDFNQDGISDRIGFLLGIANTQIDSDGDGVSNIDEISQGTNPMLKDTDGDSVNDSDDDFPFDLHLTTLPTDSNDSNPPVLKLVAPPEAILSQP